MRSAGHFQSLGSHQVLFGISDVWVVPFGKVVLDLVIIQVWCEENNSSLVVLFYVVYRGAAPSVYDHPVYGSFLWGVATFLSGAFCGLHLLGVFVCRLFITWSPAPFDCPWVTVFFRGLGGLVNFFLMVAFLLLFGTVIFVGV